MGIGAPRTEEKVVELKGLSADAVHLLSEALAKLDATHEAFRESREEERQQQLVKLWNQKCRQIDDWFRAIAKVLINSHQLSLDMGSDGGGRSTRPWLEETSQAFARLTLSLEDEEVVARTGDQEVLRGPVDRLSYEWIEEAVIQWVLIAVEATTAEPEGAA